MPRQSVLSVSWGCGAAGAAGIVYAGVIGAGIRRIATAYVPAREDWVWNMILPAAAYGCLFAVAFLIWRRPVARTYGIAASLVLLMFVGIHNAWDIAVWNILRKQDEPRPNP